MTSLLRKYIGKEVFAQPTHCLPLGSDSVLRSHIPKACAIKHGKFLEGGQKGNLKEKKLLLIIHYHILDGIIMMIITITIAKESQVKTDADKVSDARLWAETPRIHCLT